MHLLQEELAEEDANPRLPGTSNSTPQLPISTSQPPAPTTSQPAASGRAAQASQLRPHVPAQPRPGQRAELLTSLRAKALTGAPAPSAGRLAIVADLKAIYCRGAAPGEGTVILSS